VCLSFVRIIVAKATFDTVVSAGAEATFVSSETVRTGTTSLFYRQT